MGKQTAQYVRYFRPVTEQSVQLDGLDARLLELLAAEPRIGVLELSRRLAVARGTVQARLDKLIARGAIKGFGPEVQPAAIGFGVTSFVTLEIIQRSGHDAVAEHLAEIPEVLEAHTIIALAELIAYRTVPLVKSASRP